MAIELSDVKRIALLARIEISDADAQSTLGQLTNIFGLIEEMKAVDTEGVEPMSHGIEVAQRLRADQVTESNHREAYQACAPAVEDGLYLVPKVIE